MLKDAVIQVQGKLQMFPMYRSKDQVKDLMRSGEITGHGIGHHTRHLIVLASVNVITTNTVKQRKEIATITPVFAGDIIPII
jgi:hypothetical protein